MIGEAFVGCEIGAGLRTCSGSFLSRRPRNAAPRPAVQPIDRLWADQWLPRRNFFIPGY